MNQPKYTDNTGKKAERKKRVRKRLSESAITKKKEADIVARKAVNKFKETMGM